MLYFRKKYKYFTLAVQIIIFPTVSEDSAYRYTLRRRQYVRDVAGGRSGQGTRVLGRNICAHMEF